MMLLFVAVKDRGELVEVFNSGSVSVMFLYYVIKHLFIFAKHSKQTRTKKKKLRNFQLFIAPLGRAKHRRTTPLPGKGCGVEKKTCPGEKNRISSRARGTEVLVLS